MTDPSSVPQREPWYHHWYVPGLIAFFGGLLILVLEVGLSSWGITIPVIGSVSLLLSLLAFSIGWTLEIHKKSLQELIEGDLNRIASTVEAPYFRYLRDQILSRARRPLRQLVDEGSSLATTSDCTEELIKTIGKLDERCCKEILAICGQKDWDAPEVKTYYEANYERASRGIKVRRIFIQEPGKVFSTGEKAVIREHLNPAHANVEARVIFKEQIHQLSQYHFTEGFGFAILDDTVIVHWGLGKNVPAGRKFVDPMLAEEHRRIFERLWRLSLGGNKKERDRIYKEIL